MHSCVYDQYLCITISIPTLLYVDPCTPCGPGLELKFVQRNGNIWNIIKKCIQYMQSISSELGRGEFQMIETLPGQSIVKSPHLYLLS